MRCLVVGGGAVGQVLGASLARGGAEVGVVVRPRQVETARRGFPLYRVGWGRGAGASPEVWRPGAVFAGLGEVDGASWDLVVLAVSSTALDDEDWLDELVTRTAPAPILTVQPGLGDAERLAERAGGRRVLRGMVGFLAWATPLPGAVASRPGTGFWTPPSQATLLEDAGDVAADATARLRTGGLAARTHSDVAGQMVVAGPLIDTIVAALEVAGWSFDGLAADRELRGLAVDAVREAVAAAAAWRGGPPPLAPRLLTPGVLRSLPRLASRLVPFDLEGYFTAHFSKVSAQTRRSLRELRRVAAAQGLPHGALSTLLGRLDRAELGDGASSADRHHEDVARYATLGRSAVGRLARQEAVAADPAGPNALKRNVHELVIDAPAARFAAALSDVLTDPARTFAGLRLRRAPDRVGRPFHAGERFQGCFEMGSLIERLPASVPAAVRRGLRRLAQSAAVQSIEDRWLSDFAELASALEPSPEEAGDDGVFEVVYRYLDGGPLAGQSAYRVVPVGSDRCRFETRFEFQERSLPALFLLHLFGVRAHDRVVAAQVRQAAEAAGAVVLESSLRV